MKKITLFALAAIIGLSACSSKKETTSKEEALKKAAETYEDYTLESFSEKDSVAYCLGIDFGKAIGQQIETMDNTLNVEVVMKGIVEGWANNEQINIEDAYAFLNDYFYVRVPARNLAESKAFLEEVANTNPNVKITNTGLMYEIIEPGSDLKPTQPADMLKVNYKGYLKNGEIFDQNDSIDLPLGMGMIQGWEEGLKFIGEGGKIKLWIPAELGYGNQPRGNKIKANDALVFEVDLIEVVTVEMQGKGSQK